jgi:opacity protein-like surface antigen
MVSVKSFLAAAVAAVISTAACAADMPMPPPPQMVYQPAPCCGTGGWYLRGDIGIGVQTFSEFDFTQTNSAFVWPSNWQIVQKDIQDTAIFGLGVGYVVNNWLRVDVTGEYRTEAAFKATGSYSGLANFCNGGVGTCFDVNTGNISSSVFMANAYVDLGTWWCLTPFIGAGVGGAYNRISGVQDNGIISGGSVGFGYTLNDNSAWTLAWNVQAGVTYNVNDNFKIDFSWRYLDLGSPQTAIVQCQNTTGCPSAFYTLKDMTSEDFRISFRWMIQPNAGIGVMAAQPVFAQQPQYMPAPQPQYVPAPPPQYVPMQPQYAPMQPPLSSRG